MSTPLVWEEWDRALRNHPDQRFKDYIIGGIRHGFRLGFNYKTQCKAANRNMRSALERPQVVSEYLAAECAEGRVLGPLDPKEWKEVMVSSIGVIPKGSWGWRLIVDFSSPEGASVNEGIDTARCSLTYCGVEDAAREVMKQGRNTVLAKVDIKSAYRVVPVHPDDRWLLGMRWEGALFVDVVLSFGLRSAPKIFTAVADAAEWIVREAGVKFVIHYQDDFLVVGPPGSGECEWAVRKVMDIFRRLELPVAREKLEGPISQCLTFLGVEIDSQSMELRLPERKLTELQQLVRNWQGRKSCTRRDLESLVGKLAC